MNNINDNIVSWIVGSIFGWISVVLIALSIIPQTIKTCKSKDNNFGALITFGIYLFSGLCYLIASLLLFLFKIHDLWFLLEIHDFKNSFWFLAYYWAPISLNIIGSICATIIIISISMSIHKIKKTWQNCKNDVSCWVVDYQSIKKTKGFAKIVLFFRTKVGFILIVLLLFSALLITVGLFFLKLPDPEAEHVTKKQLILLLIFNGCGAITWTSINWPLFFSAIKKKEINNISLWYILFNFISSLTLLVYGIVVMQQVGWTPITIFGCIFNGSGSSLLILYRKIKSLNMQNKQIN